MKGLSNSYFVLKSQVNFDWLRSRKKLVLTTNQKRAKIQNVFKFSKQVLRIFCFNFYKTTTSSSNYSGRRLIGSRIIESAAYCNQKFLAHLYHNSTLDTSVN
jgi:hypothetical protein